MAYQVENIYVKRFLYFNLYVIKGIDGDILIDTGFIGIRRGLKKWLDNFDIKLVILTHAHVDHIWNANYIKGLYNCKIAMSYGDIKNIDNSRIHSHASSKKYTGWTKLMNLGMRKFVPEKFDVDIVLHNNQVLDLYGIKFKIIALKGHTKGSVGVLYRNYLFAGDALVNRKRYPEVAYQNQNNREAKKSYNKILELAPQLIFVGHDRAIKLDKLRKDIYN